VIDAGQTIGTITVTVVDDALDEVDETVVLTLGVPTNATLGATSVHTATIADDDAAPTVQFMLANQSNAEGVTTVTATVQLLAASGQQVTVPFTVSGTAVDPADYTVSASPVVIPAGQTTGMITVTVVDDVLNESAETVVLSLGAPINATLGATTVHTATITDNDGFPTVQFTSASQSNAEGATTVTATVQLSAVSALDVTVPFTMGGTAVDPDDYTVSASPVVINAGQTAGTVTLTVVDDALDEVAETVVLTLGAPTNATLGATTIHTATITDNDAPPTVQFTAASQNNSENVTTVTATVQLSAVSSLNVTVPFAVGGTAGNPADYTVSASPVVINAGSTTGTVTLTVVNDAVSEVNETVVLTLGAPTNATLGVPNVHTATIANDDGVSSVTLTVDSTVLAEDGTGPAIVTATLSPVSAQQVTVDLGFTGTAVLTTDYTRSGTQIVIDAGQTTGTVTVNAANNALDQPDRTVIVDIIAVTNGAESGIQQVTTTITDDDTPPTVSFTSSNQTNAENVTTVTATVQLSTASGQQVTVPFTVGGTATDPTDYTVSATPVVIPAGQTTGTITVTVVDDGLSEGDETAVLTLSVPTNATLGATTVHTVTIADNEGVPTVAFTSASQSNAEGVTTVTATVQLSGTSGQQVTVPFTVSGTAVNPDDYTVSATPVVIAAGQTIGTITVTVVDDALDEVDETVVLTLGAPTNADLGATSVHTATICDQRPYGDHRG